MKLTGKRIFQCFSFQLGCLVPLLWGGVRTSDTIYNPLPLYHSSAGMLSIGPCFYAGVKVAMRNKFSANNFWKDCVKYNATVRIKPLLWLKFFNNFVKLTINLLTVMGMWYDKSNFPFLERSYYGFILGLMVLSWGPGLQCCNKNVMFRTPIISECLSALFCRFP